MRQVFLLFLVAVLALCGRAQPPALAITTSKTTSVVFPSAVRHVDRGSRAVLVQQVPGADHILLVRAAEKNFEPTNLSVVTEDGGIFSLGVVYDPAPGRWVYTLRTDGGMPVEQYARSLLDHPRAVHGIGDRRGGVSASLQGLYIRERALYFVLELENSSALDFSTGLLRFSLQDKKKGRRTALQETELTPLYVAGAAAGVRTQEQQRLVAALPRFTPPVSSRLLIELVEKEGGRRLLLRVPARRIYHAERLPEVK